MIAENPTAQIAKSMSLLNHIYHTCATCGKPESAWDQNGICPDCESASPEAIAAAEKTKRVADKEAFAAATVTLSRIVPPEIMGTDIHHPDFNRGTWARIEANFNPESPDWFWLRSRKSGRCKTRCAYLILRNQLAAGIRKAGNRASSFPSVAWIDGDQLAQACRNRHQFSVGENVMSRAHHLIEEARAANLLVIDDLSKRKISGETVSDGIWEIIKHRHEWHLRTIITDNTEPGEMEKSFHEKHAPYIIRRLAERCIDVNFDL
jgi:hypothetical protein